MTYHKPPYPYTLGRGILFVRKADETEWTDLFHLKEFKVTIETEELEHENMRSGLKRVDATVITKQKAKFSCVVDVPCRENILMYLLGDTIVDGTQVAGTWTAEEFTVGEPDKWHELGKKLITMTAITDDAGTPVPLVEGTDYYADWDNGLLLPLSTSTLIGTTGDKFKITGSYIDDTSSTIEAGKTPNMFRHIKFVGDPAKGYKQNVHGYALLKPSGDLSLIGDEWENFTLEGTFQEHADYGKLGLKYEELKLVS